MNAETVKNECEVIIGFENNFMEKGVAVTPLVPFTRKAKYLTFEGHHVTIPSGHIGVVTEVHFGVIIGQEANEEILKDRALEYVNGYVVALNSRLRDDEYKKEESDTFSTVTDFKDAVIISNVITKELLPHPNVAEIWASVNGKEVQRANMTDARMSVQELIEKASELKTLHAGDLILSGSPSGAFFVKSGDSIEIGIVDIMRSEIQVQKEAEVMTTVSAEPNFRPKDKEFPQ